MLMSLSVHSYENFCICMTLSLGWPHAKFFLTYLLLWATSVQFPCHLPYTCNGNWANSPGIFPHNIVLGKVITGRQVVSGPLARSARWAGKLISQVFMRLTGCTNPAAVLTWETKIWTVCGRFSKGAATLNVTTTKTKLMKFTVLPACIFFISLRSQGSLHCDVGTTSLGQRIKSLLRLKLSAHSPTGT